MPSPRPRSGRRKSALPPETDPAVKALKKWLRGYVGDTPLEEVAAAASYCVSAVSTALGGTELPGLRVVRSIAAGVGASQVQAHKLWWAAALEDFAKRNPAKPDDPLADFALDLCRAMLMHDLGKTEVLRRMTRLCEAEGNVIKAMSRATLCRLLDGTTLPRPDQMNVFLRVIGLRESELEQLTDRYEKLDTARALARAAKSKLGSVAITEVA